MTKDHISSPEELIEELRGDNERLRRQVDWERGIANAYRKAGNELCAEKDAEIKRLQHYADTCGGSDNDGRCPMRHLLGSASEPLPSPAGINQCVHGTNTPQPCPICYPNPAERG